MKTITSKLTLLTLIIFLISTSLSYSKKDPRRTNSTTPGEITYVVNIDPSDAGNLCYTYIVYLRDENGNNIDSRIYMEGIDTYEFHERGPVNGTRSAHLERIDYSCSNTCHNIFYTPADHIQSDFRNGRIYIFKLYPSAVQTNN